MITNLIVVGFVGMMAFYWYTQGLFSAFLHLAAVVAAGALAFALWEPAAYWLLGTGTVASHYAWGISLVSLFIICLSLIRTMLDKFVPGNAQFQNLANLIGGGLCGLASGLLTAGVMIIGIGFMPLPMSLGGYQPYSIGPDDRPQKTGSDLWVPADQLAAGFFGGLSSGAFAPWGTPASLETHRPNLVAQSALFRFRYDEHASLVVDPDMVEIQQLIEYRLPGEALPENLAEALGQRAQQAGQQLIVLDTQWEQHAAGYDRGTIRIGPAQVQLVTRGRETDQLRLQPNFPVAFSKDDVAGDRRELYPFLDERVVAYTSDQSANFAFAFIVPADHEPVFALIRQVRYPLRGISPVSEADTLLAALGQPTRTESADADDDTDTRPAPSQAEGPLEQTNRLDRQFSKNYAPRFNYDGTSIVSGTGEVRRGGGRLTDATRVDSIHEPSHQRMVRLRADVRAARSLLGQIHQAAERVHGIQLEDHRGQRIDPVAYVWLKSGGDQEIRVDLDSRIRSATQLPRPASIGSDDELYLYFLVSPGITIQRYHLGPNDSHDVEFEVQ
ncbi:CvpA family protein [Phycisphaerales bacterium AB-hyl4]|uniref:CvpA family protein n=1 Tax=Natronomicrosphaera hydrolytica TaxID=3242702 RepID=A0ABV4U733_9BACT